MDEPEVKRAVAFFDGQNLYRHAKDAFGHHYPNYDPKKLLAAICSREGWAEHGIRFYTGTPAFDKDVLWHGYWSNRLLAMRRAGILVTSRVLRYHDTEITQADGTVEIISVPHEKGIDVRLALDVVRLARSNQLDVAVIFSQDQDLAEVVEDVIDIARSHPRWIKVASAFPVGVNATSARGINNAYWVEMDQVFYDACLDPKDYRPKQFK